MNANLSLQEVNNSSKCKKNWFTSHENWSLKRFMIATVAGLVGGLGVGVTLGTAATIALAPLLPPCPAQVQR
jgi:uncharacterized membrane protein